MELTAPKYDEATHTETYAAKVLSDYEKLGITFQEQPKGADALHAEFGAASLFIDDCPDIATCFAPGLVPVGPVLGGPIGACWSWSSFACLPCNGQSLDYYAGVCNNAYTFCNDQCYVYTA
jgi:hypothetical protein